MSDDIPEASALGPDDSEKRAFAWEILKGSNDVVVGFARLMSTTSMAAIGVLITLAGLVEPEPGAAGWKLFLLGFSCTIYLAAALVFSYVIRGRRISISPDDYDDVVEQFLAAARLRQRATNVGLGMVATATLTGVTLVLVSVAERV
jgi:hypothetical protein